MDDEQFDEFIERLDATGHKREFEVAIRVADAEAFPTQIEISNAIFELVRKKTAPMEGGKRHFHVAVSTSEVERKA